MTRRRVSLTRQLKEQGFDLSRSLWPGEGARVGCSQCQAVCINGVACHETGCPNIVREAHRED